MENTLENKAKFFAQYWGQNLLYVGGVGLQPIGYKGWNLSHPDFFLQLKPISSISDEDAIDLIKLKLQIEDADIYDDSNRGNKIKSIIIRDKGYDKKNIGGINSIAIDFLVEWSKWADSIERFHMTQKTRTPYQIVDFLRSKGYALPFKGLSVEKQIEYGWIKLK